MKIDLLKLPIILVLIMVLSISCKKKPPYYEFEQEILNQMCECNEIINKEGFWAALLQVETCDAKTKYIIRTGLLNYPEDPRLSKIEYKRNLDKIVEKMRDSKPCLKE